MNNITVGALADNLRDGNDYTDLSLGKEYPAYYSRKYYVDYNQQINNTGFKKLGIDRLKKGEWILSLSSHQETVPVARPT